MYAQKPLRLTSGLEFPHATLSDSRWLMREFRSIVGVLRGIVDCIRHQFAMSDTVIPKLVGDDSSRFVAVRTQQALEETFRCCSVSASLKENINHFAILVHCPPKIVLHSSDSHENLIEAEGVSVTTMPMLKSPGELGAELDTPQSDRFVADNNATFGRQILDIATAQIEAMIQPNNVLNDLRREAVTFVHR